MILRETLGFARDPKIAISLCTMYLKGTSSRHRVRRHADKRDLAALAHHSHGLRERPLRPRALEDFVDARPAGQIAHRLHRLRLLEVDDGIGPLLAPPPRAGRRARRR